MKPFAFLNDTDRLILGTVQLGIPYGVANCTGQPGYEKAREIIKVAWDSGIRVFDTAQGYGESEQVLVRAFRDLDILERVSVITKIDPEIDHKDYNAVREAVERSSEMFGHALVALMLHSEEDLKYWSDGLGEVLRDCRDQGMFQYLGASVYEPSAARQALETEGIEIVQLPASILDRRHDCAGVMSLAKKLGKKIVIRSVFLQGALLLSPNNLPERIQHARNYLEPVTKLATNINKTTRDLALGYVRGRWPECLVVFGAEQPEQVVDNVLSWKENLSPEILLELDVLGQKDIPLEVLRPDMWEDSKYLMVGIHIRLRLMQPSDAWGDYVKWMNDPVVTRFLESRFTPYSSEELEYYILAQRSNVAISFLAIEEIESGRHIGTLKIGPQQPVHGTADIGLIIGAKDCWGKGYATEAIGLGVELAFTELSIRKLIAGYYSNNNATERIFSRNGFVQEGRQKQNVMDGETLSDVILLGLLQDSWLGKNKT